MKTGPQPSPRFKMPKLDILLAFGLLIVVIVLASWYAASHKSNSSNNSSTPSGWSQFTSNKYGFKFNYPGSWGTPQVTATAGGTGSHYQIAFVKDPKSTAATKNLSVSIGMDSADFAPKGCSSASCQTALTSKVILANLKTGSNSLIKHDGSSYAFLATIGSNSALTDVQTVNLTKINTTGAIGIYTLNSTKSCPAGKLAATAQSGCITTSDYSTLSQVLKSLQAF